jgi:hypothetical protein
MNNRSYQFAFFVFLLGWLACSVWFYGNNIYLPPTGRHAWAMSDYYAMALRFCENGLNIFHPQTYNLSTRDGITASDFPLPAWLSAVVMTTFHIDSPFVLRFITWLAGLIGLAFLFRTLAESGVSPWRTAVLTLFLGCLTGWVCYADSMLPTPFALSAFIAGLWGLRKYIRSESSDAKALVWCIAGLTLAALIRKPFVLYLAGLAPFLWWSNINRRHWLIWGGGLLVFAAWELYDRYLGMTYGSRFLRVLMYPESARDAWQLSRNAFNKWGLWWFSPPFLVWVILIVFAIFYPGKPSGTFKTANRWLFTGALAIGILYFFSMLRQYSDHEYYGLDSFYPALLTGAVGWATATEGRKWLFRAEFFLLLVGLMWSGQALNTFWDISRFAKSEQTARVYAASRPLLDSLHIPSNARMMVFEAYSDNQPLLGMRRTGYCLKESKQAEQEKILLLQPDFAVCLDTSFLSDVVNDYPEIANHLDLVGRNKDLLVFRTGQFAHNGLEPLLASTWITLADTSCSNADSEYLLGLRPIPSPGKKVVFYGKIAMNEPGDVKATISLFKSGRQVLVTDRSIQIPKGGQMFFRSTDIRIPAADADEMRVYIWNPGHHAVSMDHFRISILGNKN